MTLDASPAGPAHHRPASSSAAIRALFIAARQARLTIQISPAGPINETLLKVSGLNQIATVVTLD